MRSALAGRGPWLDVCSSHMAPRVALVVVLLTILLVAWQLLVRQSNLRPRHHYNPTF